MIKEQQAERQGIMLTNYVMEKTMNDYDIIRLLDNPEIKRAGSTVVPRKMGNTFRSICRKHGGMSG